MQPGDELARAGDHVRDHEIDVAVVGAQARARSAPRTAAAWAIEAHETAPVLCDAGAVEFTDGTRPARRRPPRPVSARAGPRSSELRAGDELGRIGFESMWVAATGLPSLPAAPRAPVMVRHLGERRRRFVRSEKARTMHDGEMRVRSRSIRSRRTPSVKPRARSSSIRRRRPRPGRKQSPSSWVRSTTVRARQPARSERPDQRPPWRSSARTEVEEGPQCRCSPPVCRTR